MQAVLVGRSRRGTQGRYQYTGSFNTCTDKACIRCLCYLLASSCAIGGTILVIFGTTSFMRTSNSNKLLTGLGALSIILAIIITSCALYWSKNLEEERIRLSSRLMP